jgi:hypothetical protein
MNIRYVRTTTRQEKLKRGCANGLRMHLYLENPSSNGRLDSGKGVRERSNESRQSTQAASNN